MKRCFCLLLLLLILAVVAAACGESDSGDDNGTTTTSGSSTTSADATSDELVSSVPEDVRFDGYTFTILNNDPSSVAMNITMEAAEDSAEVIDEAAYRRSQEIKARLGVEIEEIQVAYADRPTIFRNDVTAGAGLYDIGMLEQNRAFIMVQDGLIYDINKVDYINLDKPWYDQNARESYSIAGTNYFCPGAYELSNFDVTRIVMFNKKMMKDYGFTEDPYQLVKDGKWTFDALFDMAKTVAEDLDSNDKYDVTDRYGIATTAHHVALGAFIAGAGEMYVRKDADDLPYFAADNERFASVFIKIVDLFYAGNYYFNGELSVSGNADVPLNNMFSEDRLLFYLISVNRVPQLRAMISDFGLLPIPKYSEEQTNYYCESGNGMVAVIPFNAEDPDRTAAFLELYAELGYKYVVPAYKEVALGVKYVRDDDSAEMLDIIDKSRLYDIGRLYWPEQTLNKYRDAFRDKQTTIASITESIKTSAETEIAKAIEKIEDIYN